MTAKPAKDVLIVLTIDGETARQRAEKVRPGEPVALEHPAHATLVAEASEAEDEYERDLEGYENPPEVNLPRSMPHMTTPILRPRPTPLPARRVEASAVVTCWYASGATDRQAWAWSETY